jgi:hypothetical protein
MFLKKRINKFGNIKIEKIVKRISENLFALKWMLFIEVI